MSRSCRRRFLYSSQFIHCIGFSLAGSSSYSSSCSFCSFLHIVYFFISSCQSHQDGYFGDHDVNDIPRVSGSLSYLLQRIDADGYLQTDSSFNPVRPPVWLMGQLCKGLSHGKGLAYWQRPLERMPHLYKHHLRWPRESDLSGSRWWPEDGRDLLVLRMYPIALVDLYIYIYIY